MEKNGFVAVIFIFIVVSNTFNASLAFSLRKLITGGESSNDSNNSQVSPTESPVDPSNTKPLDAGNKSKESPMINQDNKTLLVDPKGTETSGNDNKTNGAPTPPDGKENDDKPDEGSEKKDTETTPRMGNGRCNGSISSCRNNDMIACIEASKNGSEGLYLVVFNNGESTLKVDVSLPNSLGNILPNFEVPKHNTVKVYLSSTVGKSKEIIVNSLNGKCMLPLVNRISVDNLMRQFTFYSRQVTPIYGAYAIFLFTLLFGGTWACCKFRKRSRQDGIPYQELEMGFPESASVVNVDATEGWDDDWDDNWDEGDAVKSPGGGNQVRSISADGLTARTSKRDGWENDWDD